MAIIDDTEMMFQHSALMVAALNGHDKTVELLLKAGADPSLKDTSGISAFLLAASNNHLRVLSKLIDFGEKANQIDLNGNGIWHLIAMSDFANENNIDFVRVGRHNIDLFKSEKSPRHKFKSNVDISSP